MNSYTPMRRFALLIVMTIECVNMGVAVFFSLHVMFI